MFRIRIRIDLFAEKNPARGKAFSLSQCVMPLL